MHSVQRERIYKFQNLVGHIEETVTNLHMKYITLYRYESCVMRTDEERRLVLFEICCYRRMLNKRMVKKNVVMIGLLKRS